MSASGTPEAQLATASAAVGAFKAAIEHARAHLARILALEQSPVAAFVAPALLGLFGRATEEHAIAFDAVDVGTAERMVRPAAFRVRLGQDDPVTGCLVDRADMLFVASDDFHMLADLPEKAALLLPFLAPAREIVLEPRLVLTAEVIVVAVELAHVPVPPRIVTRILVARAVRPVGRSGAARAAIGVAAPFALGPVAVEA